MRASQIMTRTVITIGPETPIIDAAQKMLQHRVGGLPVVDAGGKLIGMISDGDFIRRAEIGTVRRAGRWLNCLVGRETAASDFIRAHGRKVRDVMTPDPVTVAEDTPLERVVQVMEASHIKRIPVVHDGRLTGIITYTDFVQTIANLALELPEASADDNKVQDAIIAAVGRAAWKPCRFAVTVRDGIVHLNGGVRDEKSRQATIIAAENTPGVRKVHDHLWSYPLPEDDLGGGDFVSLQEQPSTEDDQPL